MELADGNFGSPYPPPPGEPVKVHCHPDSSRMKEAWMKIMPNTEFCDNFSECKILLLDAGKIIGRDSADKLLEIFARDGKEAMAYRYDALHRRFFSCDDVWLNIPGRVIPNTMTGYGAS